MEKTPSALVRHLATILFQKKGSNIIAIDIRGVSSITDFVLIANGNVDRHVKSLANELKEELKGKGEALKQIEGMQNGDWIVLDYSEVVIHLFVPEQRQKYQLESLWSDGKVLDLEFSLS